MFRERIISSLISTSPFAFVFTRYAILLARLPLYPFPRYGPSRLSTRLRTEIVYGIFFCRRVRVTRTSVFTQHNSVAYNADGVRACAAAGVYCNDTSSNGYSSGASAYLDLNFATEGTRTRSPPSARTFLFYIKVRVSFETDGFTRASIHSF